jgi:uncharacterized protein
VDEKESHLGPARADVWIDQMKWPRRPHRSFRGALLGRDLHGRWIGIAAGTEVRQGDDILYLTQSAGLICVPEAAWYVIHYPLDHDLDLYVDVVTPPQWSGQSVSMVDFDLDVVSTDGDVRVVDEDEFERNRATYAEPFGAGRLDPQGRRRDRWPDRPARALVPGSGRDTVARAARTDSRPAPVTACATR